MKGEVTSKMLGCPEVLGTRHGSLSTRIACEAKTYIKGRRNLNDVFMRETSQSHCSSSSWAPLAFMTSGEVLRSREGGLAWEAGEEWILDPTLPTETTCFLLALNSRKCQKSISQAPNLLWQIARQFSVFVDSFNKYLLGPSSVWPVGDKDDQGVGDIDT